MGIVDLVPYLKVIELKVEKLRFCSFCKTPVDKVEAMIQKNDLLICNKCIVQSYDLLQSKFPGSVKIS